MYQINLKQTHGKTRALFLYYYVYSYPFVLLILLYYIMLIIFNLLLMLLTEDYIFHNGNCYQIPLPRSSYNKWILRWLYVQLSLRHWSINRSHTLYVAYDKHWNTVCDKYDIIMYRVVAVHDMTDDKRPEYRWNMAITKRA